MLQREVEISRRDVERAAGYLQIAVMYYKNEVQRQQAITALIVLELKNMLDLSWGALLQATFDYSKIVPREKVRILMSVASNPA